MISWELFHTSENAGENQLCILKCLTSDTKLEREGHPGEFVLHLSNHGILRK